MKTNTSTILLLIFIALTVYFAFTSYNGKQAYEDISLKYNFLEKKTTDLESQVKVLQNENNKLSLTVEAFEDSIESIINIKSKITIKYRDQKKFIDSSSDVSELDSVIRSNSGLPQR